MAEDSFTEVTGQSWFSRIGGAIKGVLVGLLLFLVAFPLLFWNEGRAVKRQKTLAEGGGAVVSVDASKPDPANDGRLVHVSGRADTGGTLSDPVFGIGAAALRLRRDVEMFQWREISESKQKKKLGGGTETTTTYRYEKTWSPELIASSGFKQPGGHQNPGSMSYRGEEWLAEDATLGGFRLGPSLLRRISSYTAVPVAPDARPPAVLGGNGRIHDGGFYLGANPAYPAVGDLRVSFSAVQPTEVSVVAAQAGDTFEPFQAKAGGTIELLQTGRHSADAMIEKAQADNTTMTWLLRAAGLIVMTMGLATALRPLSVLADVIPFVGSIVGAGTGFIAFLVSAVLSLITIAIAWVVYRPLIGITLLLAAVAVAVFVGTRLGKARAQRKAAKAIAA